MTTETTIRTRADMLAWMESRGYFNPCDTYAKQIFQRRLKEHENKLRAAADAVDPPL